MANSIETGLHLHDEKIDASVLWASVIGDSRPCACVKFENLAIYFGSSSQIAQVRAVLDEAAQKLEALKADLAAKGITASCPL
jgi:hypothetical protein